MSDGLAGVIVRDHITGIIKMDTRVRAGRILGEIVTASNSGSMYNAGLSEGSLFARIGLISSPSEYPDTNPIRTMRRNSVWSSNGYIYWDFEWSSGGLPAGKSYHILYGVY